MNNKYIHWIASSAVGGLAMTMLLCSFPALAEPLHLTILHFNDLHGHIEQAPRIATKIKELAQEAEGGILILNGGDLVSGTPVSARFKGAAETIFLNYIENEALVPGNHDFDFGLAALEKNIKEYVFPVVAANVAEKKTGKPFFAEKIIIPLPICSGDCFGLRPRNDSNLKIGIFGLVHPDTPNLTDPNNVSTLKFTNPIVAAKKMMGELERTSDIQIALTHEGVKNDVKLAEQVKGIDVVVGGHDHVKPSEHCRNVGNIPLCQTPANGKYLGKIELIIDNGRVVSSEELLFPIDDKIKPDSKLKKLLQPYIDDVNIEMSEVIGTATKKYEHYRGGKTSELGALITSIIKEETVADIGILNAGGIRTPLKKGPITRGEIEEMLPFTNEVTIVEISGKDLNRLLDRLNKANKSAQLSGVSGADGLISTKMYRVATSSFLSNGGDDYDELKKAKLVKNTKIYIKDMVIEYIKREKKI